MEAPQNLLQHSCLARIFILLAESLWICNMYSFDMHLWIDGEISLSSPLSLSLSLKISSPTFKLATQALPFFKRSLPCIKLLKPSLAYSAVVKDLGNDCLIVSLLNCNAVRTIINFIFPAERIGEHDLHCHCSPPYSFSALRGLLCSTPCQTSAQLLGE